MKTQFVGSTGIFGGIILVVLLGAVVGFVTLRNRGGKVLSDPLSEPLNGATSAKVEISAGSGNLTVGRLSGDEQLLANGSLQYYENQGAPVHTLSSTLGQAALTLKSDALGKPMFRLPWDACNGGFDWLVNLNPNVAADISVHSGGGNLKLDLAGMTVTRVAADTGGGNVDVVLPETAASPNVSARTGAGNVAVQLPSGIAARIHATSGMGKVIIDPSFSQIDKDTYQSPDYDSAANKAEINLASGAGNVSVSVK